jgi:uncharacterized membrane protein YbhN (UPF0104 family)
MQIKNNHPNNLQNSRLIGLAKVFLLGGCLYFLISKLQDQSIDFTRSDLPDQFALTVIIVLVLMILNWYLEALRWKVSLQSTEPISMQQAWKVILGGLALNWILPFTSGDLLARVSQQQDKYQATSAAILNRGVMLCFTLMIGIYGTSYLAEGYQWNWWLGVVFIVVLQLGYIVRKPLARFLQYFKQLRRNELVLIFGLSLLRYVVFVFQFFLLLTAFLPMLPSDVIIAGIGWIFLIRTAIPLFFGGVGVREASGILFFEPFVGDLQLVIIPIFLIWIINTVIPSIVGLVFVWRFKLTSNYSD